MISTGVGNSAAEDVEGNTSIKRKRKPSAKVLELQEDMEWKPSAKVKGPPVKLSKSKNKVRNGDDMDYSFSEDDTTDE